MVKIGDLEIGNNPLLLAPMEDVSDPPFRVLCKQNGCDMMYTEFVSVEGLIRNVSKSIQKLELLPEERPIGIQIFGANIESMVEATRLLEPYKPDVIDINFGCPVKKVVNKGSGAALLKDIDKMVKMTKAIVETTNIPVTVKTRLGWDQETIQIEQVAERLQDVGIKALSIHARTRKQLYKGEADWSYLAKVKNNQRINIPIFGNGDINSPQKAAEYKKRYDVDGIMIGRASIGNPWIFREIKYFYKTGELLASPTIAEKVDAVKKQLRYGIQWKGERLAIFEMRKHYSNYFKGLKDIKPIRMKLVTTNDVEELFNILNGIVERYPE
jgi:nifR3 family TIM-barrel protein